MTTETTPIRLTRWHRVGPLTRGVLTVAASMLSGAMLLGAGLLWYGAPVGMALVELGLRMQSAGTRPLYVVSVASGLEDDDAVRDVVRRLAVDEVTAEVTALVGREAVRR